MRNKLRAFGVFVNAGIFCFFFGYGSIVKGQSSDGGYKRFNNSVVELPAGAQRAPVALNTDAGQRKLQLHFALETKNFAELQARVAKGEVVTPSEMREKYSGNEEDFKRLIDWLKSQHFVISHTSPDFTSVYATATVAQIQKSLDVKMATVTYKGTTTPAATTAPKLPENIGVHVISIDGLQPFVRAVKHTVPRAEYRQKRNQGKPPIPRPASATEPTLKVADILHAYGADGLGLTGKDQAIAILIDTFPQRADLQTFWDKNHLQNTNKQVKLINVQGQGAPLPATEGEETLDAEWTSGIASGAAIRVYASGSLEYAALDRALDYIYADAQDIETLRNVSVSLGLREDHVSPGEIAAEHAIFVKLAAIGVTVFVSSGDAGSNPDDSGHDRGSDIRVEYESSDPSTVAVGGTSLTLNRTTGDRISETGWGDSGGGVSGLFDRPIWQGQYPAITLNKRLVPDVSCVADPDPGAFVWLNGHEWPVGGTSWSAPVWAAFGALIAESRKKSGKSQIGFLAPALYRLLGTPAFRDITVGNNGSYNAGPGWDPVTGIGVPDLQKLIQALP